MPSNTREKPYLAFDLGAESGRAVLAHLRSGILTAKEIHRFRNEPVEYGSSLHWDVARLWLEMRRALASLQDVEFAGVGVDAWGVDYALLGRNGELLQNPYHYRDARTQGAMHEVFQKVSREEIYGATGIQFMPINTLYQLFVTQKCDPKILDAAEKLLTIPDLFNYWMSGNVVCEYTNATTTQMVNPRKRSWALDLLDRIGLPTRLLAPMIEPGTIVGQLLPSIAGNSALANIPVIAPATHDTGSAVAAISARNGTAFISSGTWSLVGTEWDAPLITAETLRLNFTNEGGVNGTTRLLKNVMGLWMVQCCRHSWMSRGQNYDYRELMELASREPLFAYLVDPDDASFLRPTDMPAAIDQFCVKTHQATPQTPGAYVRTILESLAFKYRLVIRNLEQVTGQAIHQIRIIGGGSRNRLLNQLTANATGRTVVAGPDEATTLGNIVIQMLGTGEAASLKEVRAMVDRSFPTERFEPIETEKWERQSERFEQCCETIYA
jgi:rhamnulokinase